MEDKCLNWDSDKQVWVINPDENKVSETNKETNKEDTKMTNNDNEVVTKKVNEEIEKKARKAKTYTKEEMYTAGTKDGSKLMVSISLAADIALDKINKTEKKTKAQFISDAIVHYAIQKFGDSIELEINKKLKKEPTSNEQIEKIITQVMMLILSKSRKRIQETIAEMILNLQMHSKFRRMISNLGIEEKCERLSKKFETDEENKVLWAIALWYVDHDMVNNAIEKVIYHLDEDEGKWNEEEEEEEEERRYRYEGDEEEDDEN